MLGALFETLYLGAEFGESFVWLVGIIASIELLEPAMPMLGSKSNLLNQPPIMNAASHKQAICQMM